MVRGICITSVSDRHHIAFLMCVSSARVSTKPVTIEQSEGLPDPGIPERPFVKFSHRRFFSLSLTMLLPLVARPVRDPIILYDWLPLFTKMHHVH